MSDDAWDCTACARPARRGNRLRPRLKRGDASVTTHRGSSRRLRHWDVSMLQCRSTQVDLDRCCHQSEASLTVPMRAFDFQRAALHACRNCRPARALTRARAHTHTHTYAHAHLLTHGTHKSHTTHFSAASQLFTDSHAFHLVDAHAWAYDSALAQTPAHTLPHMHSHARQATDACTYSTFMRDW